MHVTGDAFAAGKWPEIGCFVGAEVLAVSNVCAKELAVVPSVSGEVVGGCCEAAVAPISAKKLAKQEWILGGTETKLAMLAKKGRFWGVLCVLGEFCTAWALMEPCRACCDLPVGQARDWDERKTAPA